MRDTEIRPLPESGFTYENALSRYPDMILKKGFQYQMEYQIAGRLLKTQKRQFL